MKFVLNKLTFHNCPVTEREKAAFTEHQRHRLLKSIHAKPDIKEAAILQTCNRIEFYCYAKKDFDVAGFLNELIAEISPPALEIWKQFSREITGKNVVTHLLKVAAGLDSQMPGENQILSQVKTAYRESTDYRTSRFVFHRLFHTAFRAGKAVRTKTDISCGTVSISLAAVQLAKRKLDLPSCAVCVIGAGENAELACKYLLKENPARLIIANRRKEKAKELSERLKAGQFISLEELSAKLPEVDLLICSTSAAEPIVTYQQVRNILADRDKPLLIVDIAVPRDVEEKVKEFECVSLFNIDDLSEQISKNKDNRKREIPKARRLVAEFADDFFQWYESLAILPAIKRLTQKGTQVAQSQAERYAKDFCSDDSEKLKLFAVSLVKKVLHSPISYLKIGKEELNYEQYCAVDLINKMFLSEDEQD
ncbi:glutamyl-tRNA reductase [Planctomycetota bacterium]